jgi:hypothetical protein
MIKHIWTGPETDPDADEYGSTYEYGDYHGGYKCIRCGRFSDCIWCNPDYEEEECDEQTMYLW